MDSKERKHAEEIQRRKNAGEYDCEDCGGTAVRNGQMCDFCLGTGCVMPVDDFLALTDLEGQQSNAVLDDEFLD